MNVGLRGSTHVYLPFQLIADNLLTGRISADAAGGLTGRKVGPKKDYLKTFAHQIKTFAHQIKNIGTSDQFI